MILCDDFVFIHYPKTGGTFVTAVLQRVLAALGKRFEDTHKHGPCSAIPASAAGLPICSCVRHPFDLKVSQYLFEEWQHPPAPLDAVRRRFPHFPQLTFAEFLEAVDLVSLAYLEHVQLNPFTATLGQYTHRFLKTFAQDPRTLVSELNEAALAPERIRPWLHPVHFLRTHRLNQDLHAFLLSLGYPSDALAFILAEGKIRPPGGKRGTRRARPSESTCRRDEFHESPGPSSGADDGWEEYYTPELKAVVRHKERLIFGLFPEFNGADAVPPGRAAVPGGLDGAV